MWSTEMGDAHINSIYLNGYGRFIKDFAYLDALLTCSLNLYDAHRDISFSSSAGSINRIATGKYPGANLDGHLEGGLNLYAGKYDINPTVAVDGLYVYQCGIYEKGAGSLNLSVQPRNTLIARVEGGLNISRCFIQKIIPSVGISVAQEWRLHSGARLNAHFRYFPGEFIAIGLNPTRTLIIPKSFFCLKKWSPFNNAQLPRRVRKPLQQPSLLCPNRLLILKTSSSPRKIIYGN